MRGFSADFSDEDLSGLFSKWKSAALGSGAVSGGDNRRRGDGGSCGGGGGGGLEPPPDHSGDDDRAVGLRRLGSCEALVDLGSLDVAVSALILAHNHRLDDDHTLQVSFALGNELA